MLDVLGKITLSEVMLLFVLLFLLPMTAMILMRLRKYEARFGMLPEAGKGEAKEKKKADSPVPPVSGADADGDDPDVYPYRSRVFLSPADKTCLSALRGALGNEVEVFPKVALWATVEKTDPAPGYARRMHGMAYDFLVCDRKTGQPLTGVLYKPVKGRPAGEMDVMERICRAAGASLVFIDMAEEYDAKILRKALGIPELGV